MIRQNSFEYFSSSFEYVFFSNRKAVWTLFSINSTQTLNISDPKFLFLVLATIRQ